MHRIQTQYIKFTFSKVLILGNQASNNFASKLNKTNVVPFEDVSKSVFYDLIFFAYNGTYRNAIMTIPYLYL